MRLELAAALLVATSGAALAQAYSGVVPVPPVIANAQGAYQVGMVGGLSAWRIPGQDALFFVAPDGQTTIVGYAFGADGLDLGPQLGAQNSLNLSEVLKAQADIEAQSLMSTATEAPAALPPPPAATSDKVPTLAELQAALDAASSPEEFKQALAGWADGLAAVASATDDVSAPPPAIASSPVTVAPSQAPVTVAPAPVQAEVTPVLAGDQPMSAADLLEQVRNNTFWFEVGLHTAPTVYAFIDPDCPFCARAMLNLQEKVESGELKLRVMLTPFLGDRSIRYAGSILTSQDPEMPAPVAFWKHEIERAYGESSLPPLEDLSQIPGELVDGMDRNLQLMKDSGIGGVPFFVWETQSGARTHFGMAQPDVFSGAINEPSPAPLP